MTDRSVQSKKGFSPLARYQGNPILTPRQMPIECSAVFNTGAIRYRDEFLLLLRVENFERRTDFHVATSRDGIRFDVQPEKIVYPLRPVEEKYDAARFDIRITGLEGKYYITHATWLHPLGCSIAMAETENFVRFTPLPSISVPSNRNAVLFPEKIGGRYARLERPQNVDGTGSIWVSYSPDLRYWGDALPLDMPKTSWSWCKSGAGAVPIKTPAGWLEIYHATVQTASSENYYLGAMLLDLDDPSKVIAAPKKFILQPEEPYECTGQVPNVVFTCGAVETPNGDLYVYYGGADTCVCLARTTVAELVDFCLKQA